MPALLERFKWKDWYRGYDNPSTTRTISQSFNQQQSIFPVDRRIHPDLDSLVPQDNESQQPHYSFDNQISSKITTQETGKLLQDFVPLRPSARQCYTQPAHPVDDQVIIASRELKTTNDIFLPDTLSGTENRKMQEPTQGSEPSFSTSSMSVEAHDTSGNTPSLQSQRRGPRSRKLSATPTTPSSQITNGEVRNCSWRSNSGSYSDHSHKGCRHRSSISSQSRNTFGMPSPSSSGCTFGSSCKQQISTETIPPMPPLDHPAFLSATAKSVQDFSHAMLDFSASLSGDNTMQAVRFARNAHSLPSLHHRQSISLRKCNRKRARTYSMTKVVSASSETDYKPDTQSTPRLLQNIKSQRHSNSRRTSAEFSALQACSSSYKGRISGNWEAQVSREMVRISLEEKADNQPIARGTAQIGKARGDCTTEKFSLESPFALQDILTDCALATISDNTTSQSNIVTSRRSMGTDKSPTKRERTLTQGAGKSRRSPHSPPRKVDTIPHPPPTIQSASLLVPPSLSFIATIPEASPISPSRPSHRKASTDPQGSILRTAATPPVVRSPSSSTNKGKRKADEAGVGGSGTPPKETRATFVLEPRPHRASATSNSTAPSSYHRKRARLSVTTESRPGSGGSSDVQTAKTTGSWSSRASSRPASQQNSKLPHSAHHETHSRRSLSQTSIPVSALISPHAPSIVLSSTFHMRDPTKPFPVQSTPWSLSLASGKRESNEGWRGWVERGGSPLHAWLFFTGFLIFPIWWIASFTGIPRTRRLGEGEREKGVVLDDPQLEFDAKSWRKRCRIMTIISFFTYIPFIVLVAVFTSR